MKIFISAVSFLLAATYSVHAQTPVLSVGGNTDGRDVYLQTLDVQTEVTGNIAVTTFTMTFMNRTSQVLEGELTFPLPDGVSVSRYAIDINGRMREAVPVEKARAVQVFEEIEQRRVDPGLLERVEGNNFRTRIYPINPKAARTVIIGYEQELPADNSLLRYRLPMDYSVPIENFSVKATVLQISEPPRVEAGADELRFDVQGVNYVSSFARRNYQPAKLLAFSLPVPGEVPQVFLQPAGDSWYFAASCTPKDEKQRKEWGNRIGIVWDASLSGSQRDIKRELDLLNAVIREKKDLTVSLFLLNNSFKNAGTFTIRQGDWTELRNILQNAVYDGGTNFAAIQLPASVDELIFFTDGLSTLSTATLSVSAPVHCIVSAARADYSALRWIAAQTGGIFINLNTLTDSDAVASLMNQTFSFLGVEDNGAAVREIYPSITSPVRGNFSVAGIMDAPQAEITLLFGYGNKVTVKKRISINSRTAAVYGNTHRVWAQKKISELDMRYELNREELTAIGQQFGIVTRNTSLIVLENLQDYNTYGITPPAELLADYNRWRKEQEKQTQHDQQVLMSAVKTAADNLKRWWDTEFKPVKPKYPMPDSDSRTGIQTTLSANVERQAAGIVSGIVVDENGDHMPGVNVSLKGTRLGTVTDMDGRYSLNVPAGNSILQFQFLGYDTHEITVGNLTSIDVAMTTQGAALEEVIVVRGAGTTRQSRRSRQEPPPPMSPIVAEAAELEMVEEVVLEEFVLMDVPIEEAEEDVLFTIVDGDSNISRQEVATNSNRAVAPQPVIKLTPMKQDSEYMKSFTGNTDTDYQTYLRLRKDYISTPAFYFDMADWFHRHGDQSRALLVLTCIADMELENASLYRLLGYRLKEYGEYALETYVCSRVIQWRPMEPQSYRDYALALADNGHHQQALDTLYAAFTQTSFSANISRRSAGIEEVAVTELNHLIAIGKNLNIAAIDRDLVKAMPVDVRVVINWNMNSTDIDLHVFDPSDEECYFQHKTTTAGGRLSNDVTQGYGPEQFMLKKALKGKYRVCINYYGNSQVKREGPPTVMVEVYTNYAGENQQRQVTCLQLDRDVKSDGKGLVQVVEFEF